MLGDPLEQFSEKLKSSILIRLYFIQIFKSCNLPTNSVLKLWKINKKMKRVMQIFYRL